MKEFIEDNDGYTELGELHVERNKAVIGRIDSRYENNRKHSLLPVDSSRIIQNFSSNVTIKDSAIIPSEGTFGEKQIYIGNNFLAIYDRNTGNFISENPRSYFKNVGIELGITSIDEYHMICDNIKNVVAVGKKFFVFTTRTYNIPVIIEIDPYANTVSVVNGPDDTLFNMSFNNDLPLPKYTIIGKPFCFNSVTIGIICRKEVDDNSRKNLKYSDYTLSYYFNDKLMFNMTFDTFLEKIGKINLWNSDNINKFCYGEKPILTTNLIIIISMGALALILIIIIIILICKIKNQKDEYLIDEHDNGSNDKCCITPGEDK
jgi:hypothetical protein